MIRNIVLLPCAFNIALALKYQLFLGSGQSINESVLTTEDTNQLTHNITSVNEFGSYYYSNMRLGIYNGSIKDIASGYIGMEVSDNSSIFTFRSYVNISYSQHVNIVSVGNIRDGDLRACSTGEQPSTANICYRNSFYASQGNSTGSVEAAPFNTAPSVANEISSNAFLTTYGIGDDIWINLPISLVVNRIFKAKMIPFRLGIFGGIGYEFSTISLGFWDNTTLDDVVLNTNDTFYLAGGGWYTRVGISLLASNHVCFDIFTKLSFAMPESTKYYPQESTNTSVDIDSIYNQQVLVLNHKANFG